MIIEKRAYNEQLVEKVKALGQELIDRAEDLVGTGDLMSGFDIWLRFPTDMFPTIEVTRSHLSKNYIDMIMKKEDYCEPNI